MGRYKVLDLFAGVGGLSYGFANDDDFEIIAANEILPDMAKAYSLNHPSVKMYNCDIVDLSIDNLRKDLGVGRGVVDIIIGGPPCQAYSTAGKRLLDDPKASLFKEYHRIVQELEPKVFVFENVMGLLSMQKGKLIETIVDLFKSIGYRVKYKLLNAAEFGTPQVRKRVIIIGTKKSGYFIFPRPTHGDIDKQPDFFEKRLLPFLTLRDAISDLTEIGNGETGVNYALPPQNSFQKKMRINAPINIVDHISPKNNSNMIALMKALPEGGTPRDVNEELRPKSGFGNTYCRLWWDKPCTTITRNLGTPSSARCIHPQSPRPLTTREGARIQGFPDSYKFYGSRSSKNLQIGNAVPTMLSIALKNAIKDYLSC